MSAIASLTQKYSHIALFIFCELIAFILIINFNHRQKDIFLHSSSLFSGHLLNVRSDMSDYTKLRSSNTQLQEENAQLLQELLYRSKPNSSGPDSLQIEYEVLPARVINNSILSMRNYITVDIGADQGVKPSMGVITHDGVVGVVKSVGKGYSTVLSLLNLDTRISASPKDENFFGTASWKGRLFSEISLSEIPIHADLAEGDSIVTNGYSTIFPKGLDLGIVKSYAVSKNGAFYDVKVSPSVDFANLSYVYLLKGTFDEELNAIQEDE